MRARERIQRAKRFIHQQDLRLHRQRTGNANALFHAAGDFRRPFVQGMPHLDAIEIVFDPLLALRLAHGAAKDLIHRQRNVVEAGEPRQQRMVLKHHRTLRSWPGDFAVIANQPTFGRQGDHGNQVQQRRFAAPGVANQAHGFAFVNIKRDVLQRQKLAAGGRKTLAHGLDLN